MKLSITILSLIFIPVFAFPFSKDIKTKIDSVTIFSTDAQLNRSKTIDLKKGQSILRFNHLELEIQPNSIQLFGANNNRNITILSTSFSKIPAPVPGMEKTLRQIQDSIQTVSQEIRLLEARALNLKNEKALVLSLAKISYTKEIDYVNLLKSMLSYYRQSTAEIDKLILDLDVKKNKKEVSKHELELRHSEKSERNYQGVIEAKIYAKQPTKQKLQLTYLVSGVSWTPFYDIKSSGINKPLSVSCKATIHQNTGVDWTNVALKLSTRKKTTLTSIPNIHPWVLHFQSSYKRYSQNNLIIDQHAISNTHLPTKIPSNSSQNSISPSQYLNTFKSATHKMINKEYRSAIKHNISGSDGMAVIELEKFSMATQYKYYSVPKYDQNVYLVAEVGAYEQYDLIPAFANIFLEGIYVGKLFINPETIESKLAIMLGRDSDIIVDRRKINQSLEKRRKITGNIETTNIEIELVVKNRKNTAVDLILKDQIPVSGQEGIVVEVLKTSKAQLDSTSGTLTWKHTLQPKKISKYVIKYKVERPKNKKIANF